MPCVAVKMKAEEAGGFGEYKCMVCTFSRWKRSPSRAAVVGDRLSSALDPGSGTRVKEKKVFLRGIA